MLGSFKIGSVLGITVRVHWLFLALVGFVLLWPNQRPVADSLGLMLLLTLLFGVVFLHELGHSLVARRFGIRVYDITFWPLGGMARMSEIPEKTRVELLIAIAGPAVNFVLAALITPVVLWSTLETSGDAAAGIGMERLAVISSYFLWINLMLGVFNLVPAFPMDGGRVLRAILGRSGDWLQATERAVKVGRVFAVLMIVGGLAFSGRGLTFLPLIGLFVWFAGARELWAVRMRHGRFPFGKSQGPSQAPPWSAPRPFEPEPGPPRPAAPGPLLQRPLSEDDIERLERFRGPLRQFRPGE